MKTNKKHVKSSAALVSLGIHVVLVLVAISFVAVTVIQKEEQNFEAKPVQRPKMQLRKLQVPVNVKKRKMPKPKLRKQILVKPKKNVPVPEIKMPEITGVKGGLGSAAGEAVGGSGLGFTAPEIEVFGIKGKGEKIFLCLDATDDMMWDEMGGLRAYTIIKEELVNIVRGLPPTALFNVAVYENSKTVLLFPKLMAVNAQNVDKFERWITPLNSVKAGMDNADYGIRTLGEGGYPNDDSLLHGKFERQELWYRPVMLAMKQQADAVFLLTSYWGLQRIKLADRSSSWFESSAGRRWTACFEKAKELFKEDNRRRREAGEPPRVLNTSNAWEMNRAYFPDIERPPEPEYYYHEPAEFARAMIDTRKEYAPVTAGLTSGIQRKKKVDFTFNVVRFAKKDSYVEWYDGKTDDNFKKLTSLLRGDFEMLPGLDAIQSVLD